jgi:hypothetical protein
MTSCLATVFRRGYDTEISHFTRVVGREDGDGATVYRTKGNEGFKARGDAPTDSFRTSKEKRIPTCQQRRLMLADVQIGSFLQRLVEHQGLKRVLWLTITYQVWFSIQREIALITTQPRLRIGCPTYIDTIRRSPEATVDQRNRTTLLTEIQLTAITFCVEKAIDEHRTSTSRAPEWLLSIKIEVTVTIDGRTVQGIIRTLEMTILIIGITCTIQRVQIKATDKAYPPSL